MMCKLKRNKISKGMESESLIIFISGGVRSGKSTFAEQTAVDYYYKNESPSLYYIATAKRTNDQEMNQRIKLHQEARTSLWKTIEEPYNLDKIFQLLESNSVVLIDCLTVWSSHVLFSEGKTYITMIERLRNLMFIAREKRLTVIMVSNDVNEDIPIQDKGVQNYVFGLQAVHKYVASRSDHAIQVIAGYPIYWKGMGN